MKLVKIVISRKNALDVSQTKDKNIVKTFLNYFVLSTPTLLCSLSICFNKSIGIFSCRSCTGCPGSIFHFLRASCSKTGDFRSQVSKAKMCLKFVHFICQKQTFPDFDNKINIISKIFQLASVLQWIGHQAGNHEGAGSNLTLGN